jgi:hypothetical protein
MAFAEGWEDIEKYENAKEAWLRKFLPLHNGIRKHDMYRRVFTRLKSESMASCFMAWVWAIKRDINREVIRFSMRQCAILTPSRASFILNPHTSKEVGWGRPAAMEARVSRILRCPVTVIGKNRR